MDNNNNNNNNVVVNNNNKEQQPLKMKKLKLTYFNDNKGRNELTRLIFAVGEVPYEDESIGIFEYVSRRDANQLPYGQLPTLSVNNDDDGTTTTVCCYGQSCAIARYAAKHANLYPVDDDIEALITDGIVDSWRDMLDLFYDTVFIRKVVNGQLQMLPRPSNERSILLHDFIESELKATFMRYNRLYEEKGPILCKTIKQQQSICWADLAIYDLVKTMEYAIPSNRYNMLMADKEYLISKINEIHNHPNIQKHLKKYPYIDTRSFFFIEQPIWRRTLEFYIFPILQWFLGFILLPIISFFKNKNKKHNSNQKKSS